MVASILVVLASVGLLWGILTTKWRAFPDTASGSSSWILGIPFLTMGASLFIIVSLTVRILEGGLGAGYPYWVIWSAPLVALFSGLGLHIPHVIFLVNHSPEEASFKSKKAVANQVEGRGKLRALSWNFCQFNRWLSILLLLTYNLAGSFTNEMVTEAVYQFAVNIFAILVVGKYFE